jgi:AcrR family transcriptional regulator
MSIPERKARQNDLLRREILDATLRVFAEQGYDRVSMRKVAALIDYSPTTIYRFFKNKEELLQAIAAETYQSLASVFERARANGSHDPLPALKSLVTEYTIFCVERPDMFRLCADVAFFEMTNGTVYERLGETRYRVYQSWFDCIGKAVQSGCFRVRDSERVFLYLWDAVHGYIDHRIRVSAIPRKPLKEDVRLYLDLLFRGIEERNKVASKREDHHA